LRCCVVQSTDLELRSFFSRFGSVQECRIVRDRTGVSKGWFAVYMVTVCCHEFRQLRWNWGLSAEIRSALIAGLLWNL